MNQLTDDEMAELRRDKLIADAARRYVAAKKHNAHTATDLPRAWHQEQSAWAELVAVVGDAGGAGKAKG